MDLTADISSKITVFINIKMLKSELLKKAN